VASHDLEGKLRRIVDRIGFIPGKDDISFLMQVPTWRHLLEEAEQTFPGGMEGLLAGIPSEYLAEREVVIPSLEQKLVGATIAQRKRVLELSEPGTRKSISVLSAVVPIEQNYLGGERLKTLITCPGYIIPIWMREIDKLFIDPNIVVVTKDNRERAIKRAESEAAQFVIVGYDMTFRRVRNEDDGVYDSQGFADVFFQYNSYAALYARLAELTGDAKVRKIRRHHPTIPRLVSIVAEQEARVQAQQETLQVMQALQKHAFPKDSRYYLIVDEYHNIVNAKTKRGQAIAQMADAAEWCVLVSGTGVGNNAEGLSWGASVMQFSDTAADFRRFMQTQDNEARLGAFLDRYTVHPVRKLSDIDSDIPQPLIEEKPYTLTEAETQLYTALIDSEMFDGRERYLLLRYMIANPHKLLPENFSHLINGDDPLGERIQQFFDEHPGLEDELQESPQSRIEHVKDLVAQVKAMGEKCLIACEYQRDTTTALEEALQEFGVRRIDQEVPADVREIPLTERERQYLLFVAQKRKDGELFIGDERFRSDLSAKAKKELRLKPHEVYGMSERDIIMHEFATDPDIAALVSTRVLREGVELKEAKYIITFEDTTIPARFEQFNGRTIRSGQRNQVRIWNVQSPVLASIEEYIAYERQRRQQFSSMMLQRHDHASAKDMREWAKGVAGDKATWQALSGITTRQLLSHHFNTMEGAGPEAYSKYLLQANNAEFVASLYNMRWEDTYAGNVAKLVRDIIGAIEKRKAVSLDTIIDAGCGPLTVSRMIEKPTINIDMNKHQMEYGMDACEDKGVNGNVHYLGDIADLTTLIPADDATVFEPGKHYASTTGINDSSVDLVVSSLVFDLLDQQARHDFLSESHRVLDEHGYLLLVIPPGKIDANSRKELIQDLSVSGFSNLSYLTGTYQAYRDGNPESVDAFVIVAERSERSITEAMPRYQLRPAHKVIEPVSETMKKRRKEAKERTLAAEYFVKVEDGLDPRIVEPEPPTYEDIATELAVQAPDQIDEVMRRIGRIIGGQQT
jgi:SAM-dependent methyltransferase